MRFESVTLRAFQAHANTHVKFAPGITTIKGPTDAGKSAVLRALGWVAQNNLSGEEFIKEGEKETEVTLVVVTNEKHRISRLKGKKNLYTLDGEDYQAFGTSVPADIAKLLSLNHINFQFQHDAPFWFSESAPEVSRQLNTVIDLSIIDTTLSNIGAAVRQAADRVGLTEERLTKAQTELKELAGQQSRITEFNNLKRAHEREQNLATDRDRLGTFIERIASNQSDTFARKAKEGGTLLQSMLQARNALRLVSALEAALHEAKDYQTAATPPPSFQKVNDAHERAAELGDRVVALETLISQVNARQSHITANIGKVKRVQESFVNATRNQDCPLCQRPFRSHSC